MPATDHEHEVEQLGADRADDTRETNEGSDSRLEA
jgi:hypothetical protein